MTSRKTLLILIATLLAGIPAAAQPVPASLSLEQAVEIALARHADIEAAQAAIQARLGAERQAGVSPNPTLFLQSENWRFSGTPDFSASRDLDVFAYVSFPIETAGKKQRRLEFAQAGRRVAEIEEKAVQWGIRQSVKGAYWRVLAAETRQRLLSKSRETFRQLEDYHQVRVKLGAIAEVDLLKVRLEAERIEMARATAEMETERAKIELLRTMGVPQISTRFTVQEAAARDASLEWDAESLASQLIEAAMAHRSEILLSQALVDRARSRVDVQRSIRRPDISPYFGYKRTESFNTLIGGVSMPLPVFNRNTGGIEEALAEVSQYEAGLRAAQARVRAEVAAALAAVGRRAKMLHSIRTGMLERAQQTSGIALAAYQEGGTDLLNVLDAQRAQNDVGLLYAQVLGDYGLSQIELETAAGTDSLPLPQPRQRAARLE